MFRLQLGLMLAGCVLWACPARGGVLLVADEDGMLWKVDSFSGAAEQVGDMGVVMGDIALAPSGELFGISSPDDLYRIDLNWDTPVTIQSTLIGSLGIAYRGPIGRRDVYSLEFDASGTLFFATFAPFAGGELGTLNTLTAEPALVGIIGFNNGGDLAFAPDGRLFMNETPPTGLMLDPSQTARNKLIEIDSSNGSGTLVGSIDFQNVRGMDFVGGELIGATFQGELVVIDTVTGKGTLRAMMNPLVRAYGAASMETPAPPAQARFESHLPEATEAKNLVLVTHGWNASIDWVEEMADMIRDQIFLTQPDPEDWEVVAYDWRDLAGSMFTRPDKVLANAVILGALEGGILAGRDYEHVHLIGHSAGAGVVDKMADYIALGSPETTIQTTFLDAYAPGTFASTYGDSADWADHYLNRGDLPWTGELLPWTHNVDVTKVDPTPTPLNLIAGHAWPREFYQQSDVPEPTFEGYGFLLSREADVRPWNPGATYPIGVEVVLNPLPEPTSRPELQVRLDSPVDFAELLATSSSTGTVQIDGDVLTLQTGSPVWYIAQLPADEPINFLTADIDFVSELGAEGLLAIYFDGSTVGLVDERFVLGGVQEYQFYLGEAEVGIHALSFRLDGFTDTPSQVAISNVRTGFAQIPEPSTVLLLAAGCACFIVAWRRRRRKG